MPQQALTEAEFEQVKARVLAGAPPNMTEAQFNQWVGPTMARALAVLRAHWRASTASHRPSSGAVTHDDGHVPAGSMFVSQGRFTR